MGNSSLDIWFTGQAAQSNVWFGVLSQLRHTQYQRLLRKQQWLRSVVAEMWPSVPSSLPISLKTGGDGLCAPTDCDTLRFLQLCQAVKSDMGTGSDKQLRIVTAMLVTSLLWSTGSDTCVCHNSHDARRRFDEGPGPLSFVACGDERTPLPVRDFRFQHRCEDNLADALRACANSQDGNWISADTISRIAIWKIWTRGTR